MGEVFAFQGVKGLYAVAVFSTLAAAKQWARSRRLTGVIVRHDLDHPWYERDVPRQASKGKPLSDDPQFIERYNSPDLHEHIFYGAASDDPDYRQLCDQWHQDHATA